MYQAIIFDFDGTLVHTAPDIHYHVNQVLAAHGFKTRALPEVIHAIGLGVHSLMKDLAPALAENPVLLEQIVKEFKASYQEKSVLSSETYPHVIEMLEGPLRKFKKAIVTNKPQSLTLIILKQLNLTRYFDVVLGGEALHPHKPDPTSTSYALERMNVKPEQTLFIGDSRIDFETANNAGVDFVWMDYGYDGSLKDQKNIRRFSSAKEWRMLA